MMSLNDCPCADRINQNVNIGGFALSETAAETQIRARSARG